MPDDDSSEFAVDIRTPPGYSLAHTDAVVRQIETRLRRIPELRHLLTTVGDTTGDERVTVAEIVAKLAPINQRRRSQEQIMVTARRLMDDFPGLRTSVNAVKPWEQGGYREVDVEYDLRGPDLEVLKGLASRIQGLLATVKGAVDIDSTYEGGLPELEVHHIVKAADLGVSVDDIAATLRTMVEGDVNPLPRGPEHLRRSPPARREFPRQPRCDLAHYGALGGGRPSAAC